MSELSEALELVLWIVLVWLGAVVIGTLVDAHRYSRRKRHGEDEGSG